jgi:osmotically inducible protein OsmC
MTAAWNDTSRRRRSVARDADGFAIAEVHLEVTAKIPGAHADAFLAAATAAKDGCPVSKVLRATITMDAKLVP